jgi:hypothetical protein
MEISSIILGLVISTCILSGISLIIGVYCMIKVLAMEKSTHSVQYVPIDEAWSTDEKEIDKINKQFKEDTEEFFGI